MTQVDPHMYACIGWRCAAVSRRVHRNATKSGLDLEEVLKRYVAVLEQDDQAAPDQDRDFIHETAMRT